MQFKYLSLEREFLRDIRVAIQLSAVLHFSCFSWKTKLKMKSFHSSRSFLGFNSSSWLEPHAKLLIGVDSCQTTRVWLKFSSSYPSPESVVEVLQAHIRQSKYKLSLTWHVKTFAQKYFFSREHSAVLPSIRWRFYLFAAQAWQFFSILRCFFPSLKISTVEASLVVLNIMIFLLCSLRATQAIRDEIYQRLFYFLFPHTPH